MEDTGTVASRSSQKGGRKMKCPPNRRGQPGRRRVCSSKPRAPPKPPGSGWPHAQRGREESRAGDLPQLLFNLLADSVRTQQHFLPETKAGRCLGSGWSSLSLLLSEKLLQSFGVLALKEPGFPASGKRPALSCALPYTFLLILAGYAQGSVIILDTEKKRNDI